MRTRYWYLRTKLYIFVFFPLEMYGYWRAFQQTGQIAISRRFVTITIGCLLIAMAFLYCLSLQWPIAEPVPTTGAESVQPVDSNQLPSKPDAASVVSLAHQNSNSSGSLSGNQGAVPPTATVLPYSTPLAPANSQPTSIIPLTQPPSTPVKQYVPRPGGLPTIRELAACPLDRDYPYTMLSDANVDGAQVYAQPWGTSLITTVESGTRICLRGRTGDGEWFMISASSWVRARDVVYFDIWHYLPIIP